MDLANNVFCGIGASASFGIGKVVMISDAALDYSSAVFTNKENETARLNNAIAIFEERTSNAIIGVDSSSADILSGHIVMLKDPFMLSQMYDQISAGNVAEKSVDTVLSLYADMFSSSGDELTKQRVTDINDIKNRLISILLGKENDKTDLPTDSVIVADDLTPSVLSRLNGDNVKAIVSQHGGVTSHSAILARAMGIPAVLSVKGICDNAKNGDKIIVDGKAGKVILSPSEEEIAQYNDLIAKDNEEKITLLEYLDKRAITKSGIEKRVLANITQPSDVDMVLKNGGDGVGLFRTEFLFMHRDTPPTEEEQYTAYSSVVKALDGKEVVIRTLDVGGDKAIDYLSIPFEENPFLGYRGIRYCLDNISLFKVQIRAILRSAVFGDVRLLLPFVTTTDEVQHAKGIIKECEKELADNGIEYKSVPLGVMIETPSSAIISDLLARECDFFSIGTNDLTGYIMCADRGNSLVSGYYDSLSTAVLRMIELVIRNAKMSNTTVGMCGELASDINIIPMLTKWGLDEFSVSPSLILHTKKCISNN